MYNPQLETFIRVADAGSFNKAAEELLFGLAVRQLLRHSFLCRYGGRYRRGALICN